MMDGFKPPNYITRRFGQAENYVINEILKAEEKKPVSQASEKNLKEEIGLLRSAVAKLIVEQKRQKAIEYKYFPLEAKEDLRRIIEKGFVKKKSVNEIIEDVRHYFKFEFDGHSKSRE